MTTHTDRMNALYTAEQVRATPATIHVAPRPKPPAVIHTRTPLTLTIGSVWPR